MGLGIYRTVLAFNVLPDRLNIKLSLSKQPLSLNDIAKVLPHRAENNSVDKR